MIVIAAEFRFPVENLAKARAAMAVAIANSRAEDGCLLYAFAEDVLEPGLFRVSETWIDRAALDLHMTQPHFGTWRAAAADLGLSDRKVTIYTASASETL